MMTLLHIRYVFRSPRDVVQKQENVLRPIWEPVVREKKGYFVFLDLWNIFGLHLGISCDQVDQTSPPPIVKHVLAPQNDFGIQKITWSNIKRSGIWVDPPLPLFFF